MGVFREMLLKRAAPEQCKKAGIFSGANPSTYNSNDPIVLWIIQVIVIMAMTQLLATIFGRIRQPRVIAEIIGGVFLGPTVMGRIPGFQNAIFPVDSLPMLRLTSNIGLVLFLFIIGLEIDGTVIKKNFKASAGVSIAGLVLPLGLGAALGVGIYREFTDPSVNFGYFLLFTAVAVGITAFPVLCRILTELKLLDTTVGVVTLAAGVGNDVVGWILLALTVALVNASSGLVALWVLLVAVGYVIFLLFPVKWGYRWLARKTGSLELGTPSTLMMTLTILLVFVSAFFTDIIGIHPIFGGFVAGIIIPRTNGYGIAVTEKIEDLVVILLLPLYFALSGLGTNLGLLNDGKTWGYTILIIVVAFSSKFFACAAAAKVAGFNMRESGAIGSLMSCKGLVELIVLNIGLEAGILSTRTFSMFVVHAIILTFITTPLVLLFYPAKYRTRTSVEDIGSNTIASGEPSIEGDELTNKFALVLDQIDQLPAAMTVTQLLCPTIACGESLGQISAPSLDEKILPTIPYKASLPITPLPSPISLTLLRLIELSNRTSAVLKSHLAHSDPVVNVFKTFACLLGGGFKRLKLKVDVDVSPRDEFTQVIKDRVREDGTGMIVIPWASGSPSSDAEESELPGVRNPFDGIFTSSESKDQIMSSVLYSEFIRNIFLTAPCDVSLFVDRGPSTSGAGPDSLLVLPFFGGPDDRLALKVLVKICAGHEDVRAIAVRISRSTHNEKEEEDLDRKHTDVFLHNVSTIAGADTVYGNLNTQTRLASDTADNLIWERYASTSSAERNLSQASAISRITFETIQSPKPLQSVVDFFAEKRVQNTGRTVVAVLGRSRRMAVERLDGELRSIMSRRGAAMGSTVKKTLGDVGAALVATGVDASLLVVQTCVTGS
ncbi:Sodium/hydrogen exchanger family-domain-containing protein [Lentinula aciculospora]|uniref:Sodium/hydrogen exchanger family-domain-containing protein n=1 Tax=Lentinula aciculospora TaxID=153920 RepID=A0A9W9ABI7_9AGAR|nr:Sodium/hydrogen exchanger family-domain-containing protein [Lentinula aciculospora]